MAIKKLSPYLFSRSVDIDGWKMEARWHRDWPGAGPSEIVFSATDDLPHADRLRGLSTGVLRRFESALVRSVREVDEEYAEAGRQDAQMDAWLDRKDAVKAELPDNPRVDPERYYSGLLKLYEIMKEYSSEPIKDLAAELGIESRATLKTRLRTAHQREAQSDA